MSKFINEDPLGELGASASSEHNKLVGMAGHLHAEYPCEFGGVTGTLFAGSRGLVFIGSFFFIDKKVRLMWQDVRQIQDLTQGIQVLCNDGTVSVFSNVHSPEKVWGVLVNLHNDSLMDRSSGTMPKNAIHKRRKSDPPPSPSTSLLTENARHDQEDKDPAITQARVTQVPSSEVLEVERAVGKIRLQPISCVYNGIEGRLYAGSIGFLFYGKRFFFDMQIVSVPFTLVKQIRVMDGEGGSGGVKVTTKAGDAHTFIKVDSPEKVWASLVRLQNENSSASQAAMSRRMSKLRRTNSDPALQPIESTFSEQNAVTEAEESDSSVDGEEGSCEKEWQKARGQPAFSTVVVRGHHLDCSLDQFMAKFVDDEAPSSLASFLTSRGDSDVNTSSWSEALNMTKQRDINYMHPVNAPMAPPIAAAWKEQRLRIFPEFGLIIDTKTFVKDVPMTDCFYVQDRIIVEVQDTGLLLELQFELVFEKSTIFQRIIKKTTTAEFSDLLEALASFMTKALVEGPGESSQDTTPTAPILSVQEKTRDTSTTQYLMVAMLCLTTILQLWIMVEIRGMKGQLKALGSPQCQPLVVNSE